MSTDLQADLEDALAVGLHWLHEVEQPDDAVLQHHGAFMLAGRSRTFPAIARPRLLRFVPLARDGRAVVVVTIAKNEYDGEGNVLHRLLPEELAVVTGMIESLGGAVEFSWNGHPAETGSLALKRPAHPTLVAAVERYHKGCPEHPKEGVFCGCSWYQRGHSKLIPPTVR
jgi:hypothetical protein